ncbi:MAG: hypothetical protein WBS24_07360 [Terriglobales bacterium]
MSLCQTYRRWASFLLVLAVILIVAPAVTNAQAPQSTNAPSAQTSDATPKAEIFLGYQWLNPGGNIPDGSTPPQAFKLPSVAQGAAANVAYNFNKWWSLEGDWGINGYRYATINTGMVGPKLTYRGDGVNFFVHALGGVERMSARTAGSSNGMAAAVGGGMDLKIWKPLTLRLFEADFVAARQNWSEAVPADDGPLRHPTYEGVRLRTGLVFNFGGAPPIPVAAACSIDHTEVMVGEPLHVSVSASNFNPKHKLTYTWASNGGTIQGNETGASIDTKGANPGDYTATATVTDPKEKKNNTASCSSKFTVKPLNPPQMSCSASPSSVDVGGAVTITCSCTSPDNVPVSVAGWNASSGNISGNGNTATLNTTGASPGTVTVTATCTDSRGLNTSASSSVTINNPPPPPPPPPQASKLNECEYPNAKKPWRVDNTCKAMLDDVAGKLQQDPDAKLVVVGNADPKEAKHSKHKDLAAERAVDVKYYITEGEAQQHIDASRIECRTGSAGTATSEQWIIPAGASFPNDSSTTAVDEKKVKPILDHPKPAAKGKKAAKKKAE